MSKNKDKYRANLSNFNRDKRTQRHLIKAPEIDTILIEM
jgi:hypothetical protein